MAGQLLGLDMKRRNVARTSSHQEAGTRGPGSEAHIPPPSLHSRRSACAEMLMPTEVKPQEWI